MSKVSEALEPWVYDSFYKGDDEPDQPDPDEGETGDCCNECEYWESQVDVMIDNQIKESKMEKFDPYEDITEEDKELYNNAPPATGMVRR